MASYPQPSPGEGEEDQALPALTRPGNEPGAEGVWQQLQEALRHGMTVSHTLWLFRMTDWVVGIDAADLDDDGEIEIVLASRDGWIRAFTRFGSEKWHRHLTLMDINALALISSQVEEQDARSCVIVGLRSGRVLALDKDGRCIEGWEYNTGRIIRQISVSRAHPENIVIASEDRHIHVLARATGHLRWKYHTPEWVRCVLAADIDGDGAEELVCGSDKRLYVFDQAGTPLYDFSAGHQIYALAVSPPGTAGHPRLVVSSNRKDLSAWEVARPGGTWTHQRLWLRSTMDHERLMENRGHAICLQDLNGDDLPEILVGSEDGYLVVVDYHGQLLWKQPFGSCIYRVSAADINRDGQVEILVGTENYHAYVLQLDLVNTLCRRIRTLSTRLTQEYRWDWQQVTARLATRECALLQDFLMPSSPRPEDMNIQEGRRLVQEGQHRAALAIVLRLLQENIQYCWSRPFAAQGYIWTMCASRPGGAAGQHLVIGTDQGYVYRLDICQQTPTLVWEVSLSERAPIRVHALCPGPEIEQQASVVVLLSDHRIVLLDDQGHVRHERLLKEEAGDWACCASYYPGSKNEEGAIIVGMENNRICCWDNTLRRQTGQIHLPQGVGAVYAYDLLGLGRAQIISGTLRNRVYAHTWEGQELWQFETRDRVHVLHVADIDRDGRAEIIVGSEDRNVYVLDDEGHLRWRYRMMRGVMTIDVCDVKLERDAADPQERSLKVLVSSADGWLSMLNADGDLIWRYQTANRARVVRAEDMDGDGHFEIALAAEDQLELLQIVDRNELVRLNDACWEYITANYTDWTTMRELTNDPDEYIRGRALARLAGTPEHTDEDFRLLLRAQREDRSTQVRHDLVRAIVNLYSVQHYQEARQLLERSYQDPQEEIRQYIIKILPLLGANLAFEYLERSIDYLDSWVRHAVVKRLRELVAEDPRQTFRLLCKTARSDDGWVRQETGCVLAHYFAAHVEDLIAGLLTLLEQGTPLDVFEQLAYTARPRDVRNFLLNLLRQLQPLRLDELAEILGQATERISALHALGVSYGEELLQVYEEFRQMLDVRSIGAIAGYQRVTRSQTVRELPGTLAQQLAAAFDCLAETARVVATYERRQTLGERVSSLIEAEETLECVREGLQIDALEPQAPRTLVEFPQTRILLLLVRQWSALIRAELARMRGSADLVCALSANTVPDEAEVSVVLQVSNDGQCAADNVHIELAESADFDVLDGQGQTLAEVSIQAPKKVHLVLHLRTTSARLVFHVQYDDAERQHKHLMFADEVEVRPYQVPYHVIANPYTTGTPIRDRKMFYGRTADLEFLRKSLGSTAANRVVLLRGQRRMGKTSLIYQLTNELAAGAYVPVFIDVQKLALLTTAGQLLEGFAQHIADQVHSSKHRQISRPVHERFLSNPSGAFDAYLAAVREDLPGHRLILLIDEFDGISTYLQPEREAILYYLRNLMQHYPGLNFLLSGAPHMPYMEGYHAILFNIAQEHRLGKLKPQEARQLITDPVRQDLEFDSLAVERMRELTDGWPYFIHVMGEKLIQHCNAIRKSYVTIGEVNMALRLVLEEQESSIRWIWQDLSSPIEKLVLSLLAQERGMEGRIFALNDIRKDFDAYGVPYPHRAVIEALSKLKRADIVTEQFDGVQYALPIGLVKAWLRKEKPPERVIREESFSHDTWEF